MRLPYEFQLALRYLRFHRGRTFLSIITLISIAGVTVGAASLVIALALATGFQDDVRDRIQSGSAHLTVTSLAGPTFGEVASLLERIRAIPGVAAAGPVLFSEAMLVDEELGTTAYVQLEGVDPARHGAVIPLKGDAGSRSPFPALSGPTVTGRGGILLGAGLADKLGVVVGDTVRVLVPRVRLTPFAPVPRSRVFEVVGLFHSEHYDLESQRAYVPISSARRLLDSAGRASWIEVRLDDIRRLDEMKARLAADLDGGWVVLDLLEQNRELLKALNTEKLVLFLAIGLILVVASLNIVSTLILMVADKTKEIGTLTALGARPGGVARIFLLQGMIIGALGTALGLVLGYVASWFLDHYRLLKLDPEVYYLSYVRFSPQLRDLVFVASVTLLISLLATLYPAWKAARQDPVEALRYE